MISEFKYHKSSKTNLSEIHMWCNSRPLETLNTLTITNIQIFKPKPLCLRSIPLPRHPFPFRISHARCNGFPRRRKRMAVHHGRNPSKSHRRSKETLTNTRSWLRLHRRSHERIKRQESPSCRRKKTIRKTRELSRSMSSTALARRMLPRRRGHTGGWKIGERTFMFSQCRSRLCIRQRCPELPCPARRWVWWQRRLQGGRG